MPATDIQTLFSESRCYDCYGDVSTASALKLALLRRELIAISPMAATDAQSLFASGKCYACFGPLTTAQILQLSLLRSTLLALVPTADVSPQALVSYGKCYACPGASMFEIMELALIDQISQNDSGGSASPTNPVFSDVVLLNFAYSGSAVLASVDFPNLTDVMDSIRLVNDTVLTRASFPVLANITSNFSIQNAPKLTSLDIGSLASVGDTFEILNCLLLTSILIPALVGVGIQFSISNTGISSLSMRFYCQNQPCINNPSLSSFTNSAGAIPDGYLIDFSGCALSQVSVDMILAHGVAGGMTSGLIDTSGGTSSAPSAAGLINKTTLQVNGVTVNTN